jgi:CRISPR-associated protein Cas2
MLTVIAYDVVDDRRRSAVSTLLSDYGRRVNYSVFECELKGEEFVRLCQQLSHCINNREDRVVLYRLCEGCRPRKTTLGVILQENGGKGILIV